jgi:hypothetical protein
MKQPLGRRRFGGLEDGRFEYEDTRLITQPFTYSLIHLFTPLGVGGLGDWRFGKKRGHLP